MERAARKTFSSLPAHWSTFLNCLKYDHLHRILTPVMLLTHPKLIANALFKHFGGLFGMAMKAKGIGVEGSGEVCVIRSIGTDEIQKDSGFLDRSRVTQRRDRKPRC